MRKRSLGRSPKRQKRTPHVSVDASLLAQADLFGDQAHVIQTVGHNAQQSKRRDGETCCAALNAYLENERNHKTLELPDADVCGDLSVAPGRPDGADVNSLDVYIDSLTSRRLLTSGQEVCLAQMIERGRAAREVLNKPDTLAQIAQRWGYQVQELQDLLSQWVNVGVSAREVLFRSNVCLVVSIANRYKNLGLPLSDLVQEGNIGLLKAIDKYDWRRGHRFSTCATWWIRQRITRALSTHSRVIRIPAYLYEQVSQVKRAEAVWYKQTGRAPVDQVLADQLGISVERLQAVRNQTQPVINFQSLFAAQQEEGSSSGDEIIGEWSDVNRLEEHFFDLHMRRALLRALQTLSAQEIQFLKLRFMTNHNGLRSFLDIARQMHLSVAQVQEMETRILQRLRALIDQDDNPHTPHAAQNTDAYPYAEKG